MPEPHGQQVSSHMMNGTLAFGLVLDMRLSHGLLYRPLQLITPPRTMGFFVCKVFPIMIRLAVAQMI
jgi:hypothetical protein